MDDHEHPLLEWLAEHQGDVTKLQEQGFTKVGAVQSMILFDIAMFVCPDICSECGRPLTQHREEKDEDAD